MKFVINIIQAFLILIFNIQVHANNLPLFFAFHLNGVNTSLDEAERNRRMLQQKSNIDSNVVTWDLLYNPTHGSLAKDLWDVLNQKKQEGKDLTLDEYVEVYMKTYHLNYEVGSKEYEELKQNIKALYIKDPTFVGANLDIIVNQFFQKVPPPFADIMRILGQTKKNKYILLLPHSQGNLYANQLWDYLVNGEHFPIDRISIFGLATPTNQMNGWVSKYITGKSDFVIRSLHNFSLFIPETNFPAWPNTDVKNCKDLLCHSLIDAYLNDQEVKNEISFIIFNQLLYLASRSKYGEDYNWKIPILHNLDFIEISKSNGEIICSQGYCKNKNAIYIENLYCKDQPSHIMCDFGQSQYAYLDPGEYIVTTSKIWPSAQGILDLSGKIKDAKYIHLSDTVQDKPMPCVIQLRDAMYSHVGNCENSSDCVAELYIDLACKSFLSAEIYFNGRPIIGKLTVI